MKEDEASEPKDEHEEMSVPTADPNSEVARTAAAALVEAGFIETQRLNELEESLRSGTLRPEGWRRLIEESLFPREQQEETSNA